MGTFLLLCGVVAAVSGFAGLARFLALIVLLPLAAIFILGALA